MSRLIAFFFAVFVILSCKDSSETKVKIERMDRAIMEVKSPAELQELFAKQPNYTKSLYRTFADDTALVSHIYYLSQHPETRTLYAQVDSTFGNLAALEKEFADAFTNIKKDYPAFKAPKVLATFTGLENDLFVSDSLVIISLEAFVGPKAKYRPEQPKYILRRYTPAYIVPTVLRFLSNTYNKVNASDQTFLADMLFFGKSLEFTKHMLPNTADSLIIGFSEQDLSNAWQAQDLIWSHVIDKELLYNTNTGLKEKYFGERPAVPEVGPLCPGRIGQWLGWRIIKRYMNENGKISFRDMMANNNAEQILKGSQYRGQIEDK